MHQEELMVIGSGARVTKMYRKQEEKDTYTI